MRRRETVAWVLLGCAVIACAFTFFWAQRSLSGIAASERKTQMELGDILQTRLYKMENGVATVDPRFIGKGGTASVDGNDAVGQVNITTGASPAAGSLVHVTFKTPYATQPFVIVNPMDQAPPPDWFVTVDTNGFDIVVGSAPKPNTNYPFAYFVAARPWLMYLGQAK